MIPESSVGVDVGATLCKVVLQDQTLQTRRYSSEDLDRVREQIERWRPRRIAATGGGGARLGAELAGVSIAHIPEFEAWALGAGLLAARARVSLPERYLLVSFGTGTSALAIQDGAASRVGGTALGGGTLLGLAKLLVGAESFEEVAELARRGDRRRVDLLVRDIYKEGGIALPGDLNAASFGKLDSTSREDVAHALIGLIGENVGIICATLARVSNIDAVVYCGSTIDNNPALEEVLGVVTVGFGGRPIYLADGAFCGAVGAASALDPETGA
jgi:type II pantothenate kinase